MTKVTTLKKRKHSKKLDGKKVIVTSVSDPTIIVVGVYKYHDKDKFQIDKETENYIWTQKYWDVYELVERYE